MSIKNLDAFQRRLHKRFVKNASSNLKRAVGSSAMVVRGEAVSSILSGNKSGRPYPRGGKTHIASAAGQAPANDSGTLASSISIDVDVERNAVVGKIIAYADDGSGGNYGKHLEFGTQKMAARPFMQPALRKSKRKINQIFKREGVIR